MNARKPFRLKVPWWVSVALADATPFRDLHITKGYGSGGTYGAALWHLELAFGENRRGKVSWVVAPTFAQIEDPVMSTLVEVLKIHYGMEAGIDYELNISNLPKLTLPNGHIIRFKSAARPMTLVGENISHVWCTEPGLYEEAVFEKLTGRVRQPDAIRHQRLFEGTPEGITAWEKLANFPEGVDVERNARRIIVETADNWRLPPGFLPKLTQALAHDPSKLISYTKGLFMPFVKGTAFWEFKEARESVLDTKPSKHSAIILSCDFNNWPLAWVGMQVQRKQILDYTREVYVQHWESSGLSRGLIDACAEFIRAHPPAEFKNTPIEVHGDASGHSKSHKAPGSDYDVILKYLRRYYANVTLKAPDHNPQVKDRIQQHNRLLAYDRVKIDARCVNTLRSYRETRLKDGQYEILKPDKEDWTHYGEAKGYALFEITKSQDFELPTTERVYGVSRS